MLSRQLRTIFGAFYLVIITVNGFAATSGNPCRDVSLIGITDRGSVTDTPCVLSPKVGLLEAGYQYTTFKQDGSQQYYPQPVLFFGLPANSELTIGLPSSVQQSTMPFSGVTAINVGAKHEITYGKNWVAAADVALIPPGGSDAFGSQGFGVAVNGMASYIFNPKVSMTLMLGGSTLTTPSLFGGERFNSFNPSLVVTYAPTEKMTFFAESFGQTKTGPDVGGNYNADFGVLYLLTPSVVLDFEVGQQLSHQIYSFNQFIGGGVTMKL